MAAHTTFMQHAACSSITGYGTTKAQHRMYASGMLAPALRSLAHFFLLRAPFLALPVRLMPLSLAGMGAHAGPDLSSCCIQNKNFVGEQSRAGSSQQKKVKEWKPSWHAFRMQYRAIYKTIAAELKLERRAISPNSVSCKCQAESVAPLSHTEPKSMCMNHNKEA